jgi:hypothetical protein
MNLLPVDIKVGDIIFWKYLPTNVITSVVIICLYSAFRLHNLDSAQWSAII